VQWYEDEDRWKLFVPKKDDVREMKELHNERPVACICNPLDVLLMQWTLELGWFGLQTG
jgi:hypothetical protein